VFDRRVSVLKAKRAGVSVAKREEPTREEPTREEPSLVDSSRAMPSVTAGPATPRPVPPPGDFDRFERFYQERVDYCGTHRSIIKIQELLRMLIPSRCRSLLDVGCGTGLFTTRLAELGIPRVVGLDVSETAIREARVLGSPVEFRALNATELDRLDERFDVVVMAGVLNYVINDDVHESVMRNVWRLLRTGGHLV